MEIIQQIKERLSILEVINLLGMEVNASGFAYSIYKTEKTPSMKIYQDENRYYCFSTNNGGDQINLYQDYCRLDLSKALSDLANICGIEKSEPVNAKREKSEEDSFQKEIGELNRKQEELFKCMNDYEKSIYEDIFYKQDNNKEGHEAGLKAVQVERLYNNRKIFNEFWDYCNTYFNKDALSYLYDVRKLPAEIISKFRVCTINNYFQINKHMQKKFPIEKLQQSGLYNDKGNMIFASHLIIIPYLYKNNIVYLRGRYFDSKGNTDQKDGDYHITLGKYIGLRNDATDLNRTKRFYNIDVIRTMFKGERLYIVEGEFDAMALSSLGENAIAVPGASNIPAEKYFIPLLEFDVVLCMDSDEAGDGLKERLIKVFSSFNKKVSIKQLPTKDVNDFIATNVG